MGSTPAGSALTVALMLTLRSSPGARVSHAQVTVPPAWVQGALAETKVTPEGSTSVSSTSCASPAPALRTARV